MEPDSTKAAAVKVPEPAEETEANVDAQRRWELFREHLKQAWTDTQSSTDSYDQSLLTLSTGALALSLSFIKDIVPLDQVVWLDVLYASWILFVVSVLVTLISFQISVAALREHTAFLPKFYFEDVKELKSWYPTALKWCTRIAGGAFISGLFCIMLFGMKNTARANMPEKVGDLHGGRVPILATSVPGETDAEQRGRTPVQPTAVPQSPQSAPATPKTDQTLPTPAPTTKE